MMDVKSLEHPTLKVPYEILNKRFRIAQKHLDREVNHVTVSLTDIQNLLGENSQLDKETLSQKLESLKDQLKEMKSKGGDILNNVRRGIQEECIAKFECKLFSTQFM